MSGQLELPFSSLDTHWDTHTHTHTHTDRHRHTNTDTNTQTHKHIHKDTHAHTLAMPLGFGEIVVLGIAGACFLYGTAPPPALSRRSAPLISTVLCLLMSITLRER